MVKSIRKPVGEFDAFLTLSHRDRRLGNLGVNLDRMEESPRRTWPHGICDLNLRLSTLKIPDPEADLPLGREFLSVGNT